MKARTLIESVLPADTGVTLRSLHRLWEVRASKAKKLGSYGGLTSKMWLLPNGQLQSLDRWHWDWLLANPGVAKKFGVNLQGNGDEDARLGALRRGFFRINYERNRGQLTVEGLAKFWSKTIKDTIFMLVIDNVDAIDHMSVALLNEQGQVVRHGASQLFSYSAEEKMEHLPLISEGRRGRALRAFSGALLR
jgi:hypothetical protein